jgi:hypothetical protein
MRTTISLDDDLGRAARRRAQQEGLSLSALVARALRTLLTERGRRENAPPFRLVTVGGRGPRPGIDLDRTSALVIAEDEASYGENPRRR